MKDVPMKHVRHRIGRRFAPELVDETVDGHDLVRLQEEQREDGPLLGAAEWQQRPVRGDLKRAQDAEVEPVRDSTVAPLPSVGKVRLGEVRGQSRPPPHLTSPVLGRRAGTEGPRSGPSSWCPHVRLAQPERRNEIKQIQRLVAVTQHKAPPGGACSRYWAMPMSRRELHTILMTYFELDFRTVN